jgi:fatty-acyl-CoA synthase
MNIFTGKTYAQSLAHLAEHFAHRDALFFRGRRWSFETVRREVDKASARLATLGLQKQDKIALWIPNRPEFIWYWLGAAQLGLVAVVLNTRLTPDETAYQLDQSETRALIMAGASEFRDFGHDLALICPEILTARPDNLVSNRLPNLRHAICLDPPVPAIQGLTDWSALEPITATILPLENDPNQPAMIVYSSGTTALPKGVVLTHCVWRKAADHGHRFNQTADDRLYLCMPLFGIMANVNGILTCWTQGSAVVLEDGFDELAAMRDIQNQRCSLIYLMPVMLERLLQHPDRAQFDLSSLRSGTVVTNDPTVLERAIIELGLRDLYSTYGMSELSSVALRSSWHDPIEVKLNTHGTPMPDIEVRIADPETNLALADDQIGEIQVRGYGVTPGYYLKPEETRASRTSDGWFKTGDAGVRRADGNFKFLSRLKDGYKYNGFNVSTVEVESVLLRHPSIAAAAVLGIPDRTAGEIGFAFVVARAGKTVDEAEIQSYLRALLASYKRPRRIVPVAELPLTAGTGKVQKFKLKELALTMTSQPAPGPIG